MEGESKDAEPLLPTFDLSTLVAANPSTLTEHQKGLCKSIAQCMEQTGCLVVRDPRVTFDHNDRFLNVMERYFGRPESEKEHERRESLHYQVGVTPAGVEIPRVLRDTRLRDQAAKLQGENAATLPTGPDLKWRYMWRIGPRPAHTEYQELNADPVVPSGFPEWQETMDCWGEGLIGTAVSVAQALAIGFGLPADAFTRLMHLGPHLLAPTGSDLAVHGQRGTVFAGYHYDLNFLTLHGKSRFPGLFVWLRNGRKVPVRIPQGCILIQAGKQLEWLTGGHVRAGMHEVVVTEETLAAAEAARAAGHSLWRVSSTVFSHIASDQLLQPLGPFATSDALQVYPPTPAGQQVQQELEAICLKKSSGGGSSDDGKSDNNIRGILVAAM